MTRQQRHQEKQRAAGNCINCGKVSPGSPYCDVCREKRAARKRVEQGCTAWVKGKPGRPPLSAKHKRDSL